MKNKLKEYPPSWNSEEFMNGQIGPINTIIDEANNEYEFTCHKTLNNGTNGRVVLYGQLNEHTAINDWGARRYVIIAIENKVAEMVIQEGPRKDLERTTSQSLTSRHTLDLI